MQFKNFVSQTLKHAAEIANKNFGQVKGTTKTGDNNQVLTKTDLEIGKFIISQIKKEFSKDNIVDEEAGVIDNSSEFTWVVDPIDGTSNFANGLSTYGVMMGLLKGDQAIVGGIILPFFNELYFAEKGEGTFLNEQKIHVTRVENLKSVLVAYGIDGHQDNPGRTEKESEVLGKIILNIRNLRTTNSAYDMVQVASGKYGAYLNQQHKIWDNVAIQQIIEEAGGLVTDFWGKKPNYQNPLARARANEIYTMCAAPPILHKKLQEIIHE